MGAGKDSKFVVADPAEARLREVISDGFQETTEEMASRHVKYRLGAKVGVTDIDCSGFVDKAAMNAIGYLTGTEAFYKSRHGVQSDFFDTGAGDQIEEIARKSHFIIKGKDAVLGADLKEGMVIAMDRGDMNRFTPGQKQWDFGLDHIVLIYRDKNTGELMVGQSAASHDGVAATPLKDWVKAMKNNGSVIDLQAVDMVKLAQAQGAAPDEVKIASRSVGAATTATAKPSVPVKP